MITLPTAPEITNHAEIIDDALQPRHKTRVIHRHREIEKGCNNTAHDILISDTPKGP